MNTENGGSQKAHIRTPINRHTQQSEPQTSKDTLNDGESIHMCLFFFFFSFFSSFFLHMYKCAYPEHKQMNPKYDINNGLAHSQKLSLMR